MLDIFQYKIKNCDCAFNIFKHETYLRRSLFFTYILLSFVLNNTFPIQSCNRLSKIEFFLT